MVNGEGSSGTVRADFDPSPSFAVLIIYIDDTTEGAFSSISDENSNTWTLIRSATNSNQNLRMYYTTDPTVNADNTITVSFTAATDFGLDVHTYSGVNTASVVDHSAENTGSDNSPTVTFSSTNSDSLLLFAYGGSNNRALTSYGTGQIDRGTFTQGGGEKTAAGNSNEIVTASGSNNQSALLGNSMVWLAIAVEINADSGAGHDPISVTDTFTFVETHSKIGHFIQTGTDTWTFVEIGDVAGMFVRSGTDTWTFVETTNEVHTELFSPSGQYIWLICSFASNSTQGCIYAGFCPSGQFVTGFYENGTMLCATP